MKVFLAKEAFGYPKGTEVFQRIVSFKERKYNWVIVDEEGEDVWVGDQDSEMKDFLILENENVNEKLSPIKERIKEEMMLEKLIDLDLRLKEIIRLMKGE